MNEILKSFDTQNIISQGGIFYIKIINSIIPSYQDKYLYNLEGKNLISKNLKRLLKLRIPYRYSSAYLFNSKRFHNDYAR